MDPTLGEVKLFAGNFAPVSYAICNGQLLSIAENNALFALIGTTYGGDGQVTFALPDLRGRIPVGAGQGPGLSPVYIAQQWGTENISLTSASMPMHSHVLQSANVVVNASTGSGDNPAGAYWGTANSNVYSESTDNTLLAADAIQPTIICNTTGAGQPFSNMQPYLAMNYIIAVEGIFPSRN